MVQNIEEQVGEAIEQYLVSEKLKKKCFLIKKFNKTLLNQKINHLNKMFLKMWENYLQKKKRQKWKENK